MAEREQKKKPAPAKQDEVVEDAPVKSETGEKIKAELDDLLDEIDEVLEVERRGVREVVRAEGRRVARHCRRSASASDTSDIRSISTPE